MPEEIHRAAEKIRQDIGNVSIVVQNAGREIEKNNGLRILYVDYL